MMLVYPLLVGSSCRWWGNVRVSTQHCDATNPNHRMSGLPRRKKCWELIVSSWIHFTTSDGRVLVKRVAYVVVAFYPSSHSFFVYEVLVPVQLRVIQAGRVGRYLPVREFARGFLTNYPVRQTGTRRQAGRGRQFPFSLSLASQRIQQQVIPRHSSRCAAQFNSSNLRRQVFRSNIFLSLANRP